MRNNIVSLGAEELKYEIREIVAVAKEFQQLGIDITWENIGDPVQKGEKIQGWIKDIIIGTMQEDLTYAYSPTKGLALDLQLLEQPLEDVALTRLDAGAERQGCRTEEVNVEITWPPELRVLEVMVLEVRNRVRHVCLARKERPLPNDLVAANHTARASHVLR